jgi:hypothetical protein
MKSNRTRQRARRYVARLALAVASMGVYGCGAWSALSVRVASGCDSRCAGVHRKRRRLGVCDVSTESIVRESKTMKIYLGARGGDGRVQNGREMLDRRRRTKQEIETRARQPEFSKSAHAIEAIL